jgi:cytochrome c-type biogenesis protein
VILSLAASEQDVAKGAGLLAVYSLGLGIPFLLAAAGVGAFLGFLSGMRKHLLIVERVMGGLLVLTGIMFLTGAMQNMSYWLLEQFPWLANIG